MDITAAVRYLDDHASGQSLGRCAEFVRKAVEAGGVTLVRHLSAKDYGSSLEAVGFVALVGQPINGFLAGDVAIIQSMAGHPNGHMTMYDGHIWVSDFRQFHGLYPGPAYRAAKPPYKIYRYH
jgi:hypothetical protein